MIYVLGLGLTKSWRSTSNGLGWLRCSLFFVVKTHYIITINIKTENCLKFKLTSVNKWLVVIFVMHAMSLFSSNTAFFRLLGRVHSTVFEKIRHVLILIRLDCLTGK